jgi:hypothetical protein
MNDYDISNLVSSEGESFTISGVSLTYNWHDDPVESYTAYSLSGIVQINDGSEEEVKEGLLQKEDIIVWVDKDETNAKQALVNNNYITISTSTSGVFQIVNVIKNSGHYEVQAKRILV